MLFNLQHMYLAYKIDEYDTLLLQIMKMMMPIIKMSNVILPFLRVT
jgi:hypothetical protein